ncbi:DUF6183 family protein [Streptomyces sp. NBC_01264]|uniref:DUF6183 family protein n=1 Tax=Streptomyces sp. NBC_01264 TaxID=2903804 RepID=UPI00224FAEFC|nr:DUF6183 family protein [Streptomyces sp. NBC_01264]MCX4783400.1 DUF6183 family protein [Streptomyces sp. NBC_01264]
MNDEANHLMTGSGSEPAYISRDEALQHAMAGDIAPLRELGSNLASRYAAAARAARIHGDDLSYLRRLLATTPGRDSVALLLKLLGDQEAAGGSMALELRLMATILAQHQSAADLDRTIFADAPEDHWLSELRRCLFHELLLRGVDPDAFPALRPGSGTHPLAWLPDRRRALETEPDFTRHSVNGSSSGVKSGLPERGRLDPPTPRPTGASPLRNSVTVDEHDLIVTAAEDNWGYAEAWVFRADRPITPAQVPALLPTLPMECVSDLGAAHRFEIAARPVGDIWSLLFATASMGGLYNSGQYGAWGRLQAWRSLAGLCGLPFHASADEVERLAEQYTWFHFRADSAFFHQDGDDYGIAALSPDGLRLAVLAATDTD